MDVDVPRSHARHPKALAQLRQELVTAPVVPPVRPLELDPEAVRTKCRKQVARDVCGLWVLPPLDPRSHCPIACAARQADEPLAVPLELAEGEARLPVE